ncbi:hypothetical protein PHYBLDRAFT_175845 [Phycomyces blakesleeanus NRRL 1555(-)]|uniref:Uncharacterized protein n=1 Tax=Phycomyces blakesleeanus (strain ATCC 8743b / DSM 1359 / FGSC 10004 / NBRC 33097 / NRRL 1555) TaxID=763407 RepID=A0A162N444_PHYB8|nr:hypothetical protein PHYBLDRAFT_175845 [Phycomyces blakesleeanus NRRL 1555(-)]OAD65664.1 hypothetical protein PHYBLDRAFT_175845 [Phycomyces blakesleeanus NRRL 1555(-)]|eukprot:XP_018283704.1 hypothetical protein PHYBLDRAFT_175845 [Phycomyces blakesleeanus NRRL 1555(-)]
MGNLTDKWVSGARFPKKPGGPLLSLETRHSVDSPSTSTPTSLVPPVTAPRRTKPPKESTVRYPSPEPANLTLACNTRDIQLRPASSIGRAQKVKPTGDQGVSFLIWDGLPFTIAKSKGQTHWGSESILNYYTIFNYKRSPFTAVDAQKMLLCHYTVVNAQEDITAHKEVLRLTIFRFYGFIKIMSDTCRFRSGLVFQCYITAKTGNHFGHRSQKRILCNCHPDWLTRIQAQHFDESVKSEDVKGRLTQIGNNTFVKLSSVVPEFLSANQDDDYTEFFFENDD